MINHVSIHYIYIYISHYIQYNRERTAGLIYQWSFTVFLTVVKQKLIEAVCCACLLLQDPVSSGLPCWSGGRTSHGEGQTSQAFIQVSVFNGKRIFLNVLIHLHFGQKLKSLSIQYYSLKYLVCVIADSHIRCSRLPMQCELPKHAKKCASSVW